MEQYYSWGGAANPNFYYKIVLTHKLSKTGEMLAWCKEYESTSRYYITWQGVGRETEAVEFQFETEEPAIMFALKFGLS